MPQTVFLVILWTSVLGELQSAAADDSVASELAIDAGTMTIYPATDSIRGTGGVSIVINKTLIHGTTLHLKLSTKELTLQHPLVTLATPGLTLTADVLKTNLDTQAVYFTHSSITVPYLGLHLHSAFAICVPHSCSFHSAALNLCPHDDAIRIFASKVVVDETGDISVSNVRLSTSHIDIPLFSRLRLRGPEKAGFTSPRLAYDPEGGLIIGPGGVVPINDDLTLAGHLAVRVNQGFETTSQVAAKNSRLRLDTLFAEREHHLRLRADISQKVQASGVLADIDWVSTDRTVIEQASLFASERAPTHTLSEVRVPFLSNNMVFETTVSLVQPFSHDGQRIDIHPRGKANLSVELFPPPVSGLLFPKLSLGLSRHGLLDDVPTSFGPTTTGSFYTVNASPHLDAVRKLGPLTLSIRAGSRHQLWRFDSTDQSDYHTHQVGISLTALAPLYRDYSRHRHTVSPLLEYRIVPWHVGNAPTVTHSFAERIQEGHALSLGITTTLRSFKTRSSLVFDAIQQVPFRSLNWKLSGAYLLLRGRFENERFHLEVDSALDQSARTLSYLGGRLTFQHAGNSVDVGARHLGKGNGPHTDSSFAFRSRPWVFKTIPDTPNGHTETDLGVTFSISRTLTLLSGLRIGIQPKLSLHELWYGFVVHSTCRCVQMQIIASHIPGEMIPAIVGSLTLERF